MEKLQKIRSLLAKRLVRLQLFKKLSQKIYLNQIKNRSNIPLTNIFYLSKPIHPFWIIALDIHYPNVSYCHAHVIKKYAGFKDDYQIKAAIEHGIYFNSDFVEDIDIETDLPAIITLSQYRKKALQKKTDKKIFAIGPYIYYAKHYLTTRELAAEKKRLGKCLLAFPTHSTLLVDVHYNVKEYCEVLKQLRKKFDSVRVCLYWKDINFGVDKIYKNYGFECVTAGHMFDPLFLPRLKSIIETATMTTSNAVGTQIGYCLFMNKPHYLYKQDFRVTGDKQQVINNDITILNEEVYALEKAFNKFNDKITKEQKKIVSYYWGFDCIRSQSEIRTIFNIAEDIYQYNIKQ